MMEYDIPFTKATKNDAKILQRYGGHIYSYVDSKYNNGSKAVDIFFLTACIGALILSLKLSLSSITILSICGILICITVIIVKIQKVKHPTEFCIAKVVSKEMKKPKLETEYETEIAENLKKYKNLDQYIKYTVTVLIPKNGVTLEKEVMLEQYFAAKVNNIAYIVKSGSNSFYFVFSDRVFPEELEIKEKQSEVQSEKQTEQQNEKQPELQNEKQFESQKEKQPEVQNEKQTEEQSEKQPEEQSEMLLEERNEIEFESQKEIQFEPQNEQRESSYDMSEDDMFKIF